MFGIVGIMAGFHEIVVGAGSGFLFVSLSVWLGIE